MEKLLRLFFLNLLWLFVLTSAASTSTTLSPKTTTTTTTGTETATTAQTNLNCTVNTIYRREHSLASPIKGKKTKSKIIHFKLETDEWVYIFMNFWFVTWIFYEFLSYFILLLLQALKLEKLWIGIGSTKDILK